VTAPLITRGDATFSDDGRYRYWLSRPLQRPGPVMCFIGLNPSTADRDTDDATVRFMRMFALREGCGEFWIVNEYGLRTKDPRVLRACPAGERAGPDNDRHLLGRATAADIVVAAWGGHALAAERAPHVRRLLAGIDLRCLGMTAKGQPRHPLYLRGDTALEHLPPI
jgi:hypothetical protein